MQMSKFLVKRGPHFPRGYLCVVVTMKLKLDVTGPRVISVSDARNPPTVLANSPPPPKSLLI